MKVITVVLTDNSSKHFRNIEEPENIQWETQDDGELLIEMDGEKIAEFNTGEWKFVYAMYESDTFTVSALPGTKM